MLYKFKSRSTADLILLEPQARRLLHIMDKEPAASGIVTAVQIPAAVAALEAAVLAEERQAAEQQAAAAARAKKSSESRDDNEGEDGDEGGDAQSNSEFVSLRQRATPFIDMLRRSAEAGHDVVWGV